MASGGGNYSSFSIQYPKPNVDSVECRVCNEVFSLQGEKVPRLLICGHTVCHQCLSRLPQHSTFIHCPFDRQPTNVGDAGVWGLKKNFTLIELLEKLQHAAKPTFTWSEEVLAKERKFAIRCDENEEHVAVLYCVTCGTHLCPDCSAVTHATRTLAKHQRVALSDKPRELPKCQYHPMHLVEFACLEAECRQAPLMCYICKDYGRHTQHKHVLVETEAQNVRQSILTAFQHIKQFGEEVEETAQKLQHSIQAIEGNPADLTLQGTGEAARLKVKQYFEELHESLKRQETAALTVVDTHLRERLAMLKQQQEDMTILMSQIVAVCHQCEKTLQQDDSKVLLAKQEVSGLLSSVASQQQQLPEMHQQLQLDPAIPITFTKDNRVHIGPKMEMRVVTLGLENAGKTSILFRLKQNEFISTIPTIGFNVETVEYKNLKFTIWDVGGQQKLRPLWKHYYFNTQALIYVVDSSDSAERLTQSFNELAKLLQEKELKDASLLIFANKQDLSECSSIEAISEQFNLLKLCCSRNWHIQSCDAATGAGLADGLEWLSHQLVASTATM